MNRLELAKRININSGAQGVLSTTEGTTGYQAVLVGKMDEGYMEIQNYRKNWKFLRSFAQIPLNTSLATYTNANIAEHEKIIYNKRILTKVDYADWILRDQPVGPPTRYTISDIDGSIIFNPLNAAYIVDLYYWRVPHVMTQNSDVPILPKKYHNIVFFKGCMGMGVYFGNYDLINEYTELYDIAMGQMLRTECPEMHIKTPTWVQGEGYYRRNFV